MFNTFLNQSSAFSCISIYDAKALSASALSGLSFLLWRDLCGLAFSFSEGNMQNSCESENKNLAVIAILWNGDIFYCNQAQCASVCECETKQLQ